MADERLWISVDSDWLVIKDEDMRSLGDALIEEPGNCPSCAEVDVIVLAAPDPVTNTVPVWCPGCGFRDY